MESEKVDPAEKILHALAQPEGKIIQWLSSPAETTEFIVFFREHNFLVYSVASAQDLVEHTAAEKPDVLTIARETEAFQRDGVVEQLNKLYLNNDLPDSELPPATFMIRPAYTQEERNSWINGYPSPNAPDIVFERPVNYEEILLFAKRIARENQSDNRRYKI